MITTDMLPFVTWPHSDVATTKLLPTATGHHSDMATSGLLLIVTWPQLICCPLSHDLTETWPPHGNQWPVAHCDMATTDLLHTVT